MLRETKKGHLMNTEEIRDIISRMTLREKVYLVTGKNSWRTRDYAKYGIPSILVSDGTAGIRFQKGSDHPAPAGFYDRLGGSFDSEEGLAATIPATNFPSASAMACSWDKDLAGEVGAAIANECKEIGINILLGPGMNIHRHPLTARNFEYYSEDPVITGELASANVRGVQSEGVGTCMKHFAAHNSDTRRTRVNVIAGERALREIYLAGYERVVKTADPVSLMTCYNQINGQEVSGDNRYVRDILKGEWGFKGAAICDWGAIKDSAAATRGEVDLQMPLAPASADHLEKAVLSGELPEALLDKRCERVLRMVFRMKAWEAGWQHKDTSRNHDLAVKAAGECMVLLKNEDQVLPLKKGEKLAVIGRMAKAPLYQGTGCAVVHAKQVDIPYDCLSRAMAGTELSYAPAYTAEGDTDEALIAEAVAAAKAAGQAVIFVGSGLPHEDDDYNRKDIRLLPGMVRVIEAVAAANAHVTVVLAGGEVHEMPWRHQVQGLLLTWFTGEGMGQALADILSGRVCPGGRLAHTIPERIQDTPAYLTFEGNDFEVPYCEDIFVGYRYYDRKQITPAYPFGYGLSYTGFAYSNARVTVIDSAAAETAAKGSFDLPACAAVSVEVTNTGTMTGDEAVQLYVRPDFKPALARPIRELKAFTRVTLAPGETKTVTLYLSERDFAYYNPKAMDWVVDAGDYALELGRSSREIIESLTLRKERSGRQLPLAYDCGFYELFKVPGTKEKFLELLVRCHVITPEQAGPAIIDGVVWSFWSVSSYLDMNADGLVTLEDWKAFIDEINASM